MNARMEGNFVRRSALGLLGLVLAGPFVLGHSVAHAQDPVSGIYSCVDGKGRKLTSDRPIPDCIDREQRVLNPSGTVRARVGPTLTAQERADAEAKQKQEAEARAQVLEEKRRERALVVRYPNKEQHDKERAAVIAQVTAVTQAAAKRIDDLVQDRRKANLEMEFYKKDPGKAPQSLRHQLEDIDQSIAVQRRFVGEQDDEKRRINARFDEELVRLNQLWLAQARPTPAAGNAKKYP